MRIFATLRNLQKYLHGFYYHATFCGRLETQKSWGGDRIKEFIDDAQKCSKVFELQNRSNQKTYIFAWVK